MSLFNLPVVHKKKPESVHPWTKTIKGEYSHKIKRAHNSIKNVQIYPKSYSKKEKKPSRKRVTFMVIGNRLTKEFIYCVQLAQGLHKYRWRYFGTPIIRGVTTVEWPHTLRDIQIEYGQKGYCLQSQVAVIMNGTLIGGETEMKKLVETEYIYYLALNYHKKSVDQFATFIKGSGRPCAYLHISIDDEPIGTLIFMLYSDIVPNTCENFLRLCKVKTGGYSGTPIHRIVKDGWIQCGGFGLKNTNLELENFIVPHDRRGVLGMANDGRYLDCSTQFFVLLQPNEWLKFQFVAFGQLIDGEETLRKIEAVSTFYESPTANIIIYQAGVLNLDCQDIAINKTTIEYLENHVEDLVSLEEMLYQLLLENVFLEIEFRMLQSLEPPEEEAEVLTKEEKEIKELLDAQRAKRKKEEVIAQLRAKSRAESQQGPPSPHSKASHATKIKYVNQESVEDGYVIEEYSYSQVTVPSKEPKVTKDYYIAFTDVPYPGEVDSNFDLKRFLCGNYCLEADLNPDQPKKLREDLKVRQNFKMASIAKMMTSHHINANEVEEQSSSSTSSWSSDDVDSDEEREIKEYLTEYGDKVSFSGNKVNKIAKKYLRENPLETIASLAAHELEQREKRKISISAQPWQTPKEIKRRQTGFVRHIPLEDIAPEEEEEEEDGDESPRKRNVSMNIQTINEDETRSSIQRKQTGFVHSEVIAKLRSLQQEMDMGEQEEEKEEGKLKVRIAHTTTERIIPMRQRSSLGDDKQQTRPSVLARLYSDVGVDSDEAVPTLKDDFRPVSEIGTKKNKEVMLVEDLTTQKSAFLRRGKNLFQGSLTLEDDDSEKQLFSKKARLSKSVPQNFTTQVIETDMNDMINERITCNLGFRKKQRPWLTVTEYLIKNAKNPNTNN